MATFIGGFNPSSTNFQQIFPNHAQIGASPLPGLDMQALMALLAAMSQALQQISKGWSGLAGQCTSLSGPTSSSQAPVMYGPPSEPISPAFLPNRYASYANTKPEPAPQPQVPVAFAGPALEMGFERPRSEDRGTAGPGEGPGTPVILDLDGNNQLDVTGKGGEKVEFDLLGNGQPVKTEWLKKGARDGLLVADFNGDGKIDSGRELMRNTGLNGEQGKYSNGWEKLRALFDTNGDGKVNGGELDRLQVWVDSNGDGKTDEGELRSVKSQGVSEIVVPEKGLISSFTKDGKEHYAEDYDFELEGRAAVSAK